MLAVLTILLLAAVVRSGARAEDEKKPEASVIFYVHCYDVGEKALKDLKGVKKIEKGSEGFKEIVTVNFDPGQISLEKMEEALVKAHTYRGTKKQEKKEEGGS